MQRGNRQGGNSRPPVLGVGNGRCVPRYTGRTFKQAHLQLMGPFSFSVRLNMVLREHSTGWGQARHIPGGGAGPLPPLSLLSPGGFGSGAPQDSGTGSRAAAEPSSFSYRPHAGWKATVKGASEWKGSEPKGVPAVDRLRSRRRAAGASRSRVQAERHQRARWISECAELAGRGWARARVGWCAPRACVLETRERRASLRSRKSAQNSRVR